jgi:hypothetical protein
MGKVGRFLFGGPEKKREDSWNNAWPMLSQSLGSSVGYVGDAGNMLKSLLSGGTDGANAWANSGGMKFLQEQGNQMINSNQAAKGLLKSGSTLKRIEQYGQGLHSTYLNDYMKNVLGLGQLGLGAAGVLSDAGRQSKMKAEGEKKGFIQELAKVAGGMKGGAG